MAKPPKVKLNFRCVESLRARAQAVADREGISLNHLLERALEGRVQWLEANHAKEDSRAGRVTVERRSPPAELGDPSPQVPVYPKVGANQPCPCGSGHKYKRCHGRP